MLLYPILSLVRALSNLDINYAADIGPGLVVLHNSHGVVINGKVKAGANLTLVGGNIIGGKKAMKENRYIIGSNVTLGANAVIIGPVVIGDNVKIGASACVVKDAPSNCTLVGVPAKEIQ